MHFLRPNRGSMPRFMVFMVRPFECATRWGKVHILAKKSYFYSVKMPDFIGLVAPLNGCQIIQNKRPWKTSSFPINAHSCSLQWPNLWTKALLTNKLYKAFENAWVSSKCSKVTLHGRTNQDRPNFPYLRQPSWPQSGFYQRCETRYFKHRQL